MKKQWKKINCRCFTVIEVALAVGVMAVGLTAVLVLFPVGMEASQNAIADNVAANAAEVFIPYLKARADFEGVDDDGENIFLQNFETRPDGANSNPGNVVWTNTRGLKYDPDCNVVPDNSGRFYRIVQKSYQDAIGEYRYDFDAVARIWTEPIRGLRLENYGIDELDSRYGVGVFVEFSWPAQKPYSARETRLYYFEHFNPRGN